MDLQQYKKRQKKSFQPTAGMLHAAASLGSAHVTVCFAYCLEEDGPAMSLRSRDKQGHMFQVWFIQSGKLML